MTSEAVTLTRVYLYSTVQYVKRFRKLHRFKLGQKVPYFVCDLVVENRKSDPLPHSPLV